MAVFTYDVEQESDVRVTSGEVVTLLNAEDKEWYWVRRSGGAEGFVPRAFLCRLPDDLRINSEWTVLELFLVKKNKLVRLIVPAGSPSRSVDVAVYVSNINQPSLPTPFLFCSCVCFCLHGPFNCISFHKFSRPLSAFSLCSSSLISALLVLAAIHLSMKISFSSDTILCD